MKKVLLSILLILCAIGGRAEFFSAANPQGLQIWYRILSDTTVMLCGSDTTRKSPSTDKNNYSYITIDTLIIQEIVSYGGGIYKVVQIDPKGAFNHMNTLTTLYLPKTLKLIGDSMYYGEYSGEDAGHKYVLNRLDCSKAFINSPNLRNIFIDNENPYYASLDGVVYTKDLKTLVVYPEGRTNDTLTILDGCEHIGRYAVYENHYVKVIDFPNSLKSIGIRAFAEMYGFESLIIRDSVEVVGFEAFAPDIVEPTKELHLGAGLRVVADHALPFALSIYCYAKEPPSYPPTWLSEDKVRLAVPRNSIVAYQQHPLWGQCQHIYPIEPPIVVGVDTAEVSWVQNFSATGYVWTLYTDEAKTQRFMSLTFDANGHLTHIDINSGHIPERMPALYREEGEEEKRFAEYYSFTISGLSPETKYYYTRQSMNGTEVIDEETGSFETQSNEATGLNGYESVTPTPQKFIENGQVYINDGNVTYNVEGAIIGK